MKKNLELIKAVSLLPGSAAIIIPGLILIFTRPVRFLFGLGAFPAILVLSASLILVLTGIYFMVRTVSLFQNAGNGTPAPWAPPKRFVISGPYRYVRNPMILAVLSVLLAEALFFGSFWLLCWFAFFWITNTVYFILSEEPGLVKRFGKDYLKYKKNVRRWIPRLSPWKQNKN
jgi:protein-S-isoprenylcysteine O-methyltransferase Ste14